VILFLDTSALVRRYDPSEPGATTVRRLCRPPSGNVLVLLPVTSVEVASALSRKRRTGLVDEAQRNRMWRAFVNHRRRQYHILTLDDRMYRLGERLIRRHPLRAYDAIQLAGALLARRSLSQTGEEFRFCTADRNQAAAARAEGLTVELI